MRAIDIDAIAGELARIEELTDRARDAVKRDSGASPSLEAVVEELHAKAKKARDDAEEAEEEPIREHIVELEQAADSAREAAKADPKITDNTREMVFAVHDACSDLKEETDEEI